MALGRKVRGVMNFEAMRRSGQCFLSGRNCEAAFFYGTGKEQKPQSANGCLYDSKLINGFKRGGIYQSFLAAICGSFPLPGMEGRGAGPRYLRM
jgi:hypothetical protein